MTQPITIEDIYKLFQASQQEADKRSADADKRSADANIQLAELKKLFAELAAADEKRSAEADKRSADANIQLAELKKLVAELAAADEKRSAEADKRSADAAISGARLERIAAKTSEEVSALSSRWGRFIENFVEPGVVALFQARGINVTETHMRSKSRIKGLAMEVDIIVTNSDVAVVVEVKSRLKREDITKFVSTIPKFKLAFPNYKNFRIYGAIAAIEFDEHTDTFAYEQGLFIIKQSGETVILANNENFQPLTW